MANWLRWVLILPAAVFAYLTIQLGFGLASETLPYPDSVQDRLSQFINSFIGPWAFVYSGAKLAPRGTALHVAIGLAVLFGVFTGAIGLIALSAGSARHPRWWIVATSLISLAIIIATCIQVAREEPAKQSNHL
jgi:hypothetical protein